MADEHKSSDGCTLQVRSGRPRSWLGRADLTLAARNRDGFRDPLRSQHIRSVCGFLRRAAAYFVLSLAVYAIAFYALRDRILARMNPWVGTAILLMPVLVVLVFDLGPPAFQIGINAYVAASLILASFMRYGGCEVVAVPSLLFGKRYVVYCEGFRMPAGREVASSARAGVRKPPGKMLWGVELGDRSHQCCTGYHPCGASPCPGRTTSADPFRPLISSARWLS